VTLPITLILALATAKASDRFWCEYLLLEPGHGRNDLPGCKKTNSPVTRELAHQIQGASYRVQDLVVIFAAQDTRDGLGFAGAGVVNRRFEARSAWSGANRTLFRGVSRVDSESRCPR
jgi:hypothetical protein